MHAPLPYTYSALRLPAPADLAGLEREDTMRKAPLPVDGAVVPCRRVRAARVHAAHGSAQVRADWDEMGGGGGEDAVDASARDLLDRLSAVFLARGLAVVAVLDEFVDCMDCPPLDLTLCFDPWPVLPLARGGP